MARRVLIATPTTLLAMLRAVAYGWQQERVAESAQAISDLGRELHGRLVKLSSLLATLGSRLSSTVRAYNETVGSYEARVLPGARRFAEHGAVSADSELPRCRSGDRRSAERPGAPSLEPPDDGEQELTVRQLRAADVGRRAKPRARAPTSAAGPRAGGGAGRRTACASGPAPAPRRHRGRRGRDDAGRHRRRSLPARPAVQVDARALLEPREHLLDRLLDRLGRKSAVVGETRAAAPRCRRRPGQRSPAPARPAGTRRPRPGSGSARRPSSSSIATSS